MTFTRTLLAGAVALGLAACQNQPAQPTADAAKPDAASADRFVADINAKLKKDYPEMTAAQWLSATYINGDTQLLAAKANEKFLGELKTNVDQSAQWNGVELASATRRSLDLLKLSTAMPAPKDPAKLGELTAIATKMEGMYGAGKYCREGEKDGQCRDLIVLSDVLANSRDYDAQLDAWNGWHTISKPMRTDYQRFAELINEGAKELGYADVGEMWRSGYDMDPAAFEQETDRLWEQVKPLYEQLHCYVKSELTEQYGDKGQINGMIPAHLTGNMWAQQWGNIYDMVEPYPGVSSLDVNAGLEARRNKAFDALMNGAGAKPDAAKQVEIGRQADLANAKQMAALAEDFYVSLGMPKLPESFWTNSQLIQPRDRDVVCHASAWDMNYLGDVRIKMCIAPTEDELTTIYHELGHVYYYMAYNNLPPLFQSGAHDGFHEAIGDTVVLSLTPKYLNSIGLVGEPKVSKEALINEQMKMALDKVAFLPFGKMIDQWRWGVFSGRITPEHYNQAWWDLRMKYQGVAAPNARTEQDFDPGAKYHVPGNTPYTRYFLAHILQFQFQKALCDAAGFKGPLHECSIYGNKEAGKKYWAMLQHGQSQPWPATLKELTGTEQMDASAILDYFAPLMTWLQDKNKGQQCSWTPPAA